MAQEKPTIAHGVPGLLASQEGKAEWLRRIMSDDHGALRVGGGANLINFTYSGDKVATIDVFKYVNGVNVTKRFTFTWSGDNISSISVEMLTGG